MKSLRKVCLAASNWTDLSYVADSFSYDLSLELRENPSRLIFETSILDVLTGGLAYCT